ncbi:signal recognition particle-docking protein FtsY [Rheinheimera sp.]|uniref:signal recognition particle-docking protein FtsY n=1 Tax=Rheinheimera sp. TaxID=1869214 RepID=UPI002612921A|nr:signal recognition particle-docking protein FtsY [Rheinheimera sp.]MCA1930225.1 signal recognition particle-docking protein FtsY [Rheinheimera sp.]
MTKQNKLFSWLGFGKKAEAAPAETAAEQQNLPAVQQADPQVQKAEADGIQTEVTETKDSVQVNESEPMAPAPQASIVPAITLQPQPAERPGFFARLKQGLTKTSQNLGNGLASLFLGKKIDDDLYEELETQLLMADVGVDTSQKLIKQLVQHADRKQLKDADALYDKLQQEMALLLDEVEQPLQLQGAEGPFVILMVGVNGVGKTTTIGKMAQQFKQQGKSVMLAAGDTFRAAAVEQLQVWGERNAIPVIAQHSGADSASVIFDAYQAAKARGIEVLIADTAGRLQNKAHLMEELKKIVRVMKKIDAHAPHEVMLTLDAGTGQNALSQARLFKEAVDITGISLTKLDGTAKGGVIFAIADQFKVPIRYIGVGEGIDDLRVFDSKDFIKALFARDL